MKVAHKVGGGYAVMIALAIAIGGTGLWAAAKLERAIGFLSGPAWSTADGAMEAVISVRGQMLAANDIVNGSQDQNARSIFREEQALAQQNIERMLHGGLISPDSVERLKEGLSQYDAASEHLFNAYDRFTAARSEFEEHTRIFVAVGEIAEEIGDSTVESLEANPDEPIAWNAGLSDKWAAADGGMESSIGHLQSLYHLGELLRGQDPDKVSSEIAEALDFHEEAASEMLSTPAFNVPLSHPGFQGKTVAEAYQDLLTKHRELISKVMTSYMAFVESRHVYTATASQFLDTVSAIEEEGDGAVEGMSAQIASIERVAFTGIIAVSIGAIVTGMICTCLVVRSVVRPLRKVTDRIVDIADGEGDLTKRVEHNGNDEFGDLAQGFNRLIASIASLVSQVRDSARAVLESSVESAELTGRVASSMNEQTGRIGQLASASTELSGNASKVAEQARSASATAELSGQTAADGSTTVGRAVDGIESLRGRMESSATKVQNLANSADRIGEVMDVINDIADQTNLLALNAAIEAARAGEHGRGFAVVADEVRKLAERTASSTDEVGALVREIQEQTAVVASDMNTSVESVSESVQHAQEAGAGLGEIVSRASETASIVQTISAAASEQSTVVEDISRELSLVSDAIDRSSEDASNCRQSTDRLTSEARRLEQLVGRFRLEAD